MPDEQKNIERILLLPWSENDRFYC